MSLYDLIGWLEKNRKTVITVAVGVSVVVAVVVAVVSHQNQKEARASAALSEIRIPYNPGQAAPAGTVDALLKLAQEHSGSRAAGRALLLAAGISFSENNFAAAHSHFSKLLQDFPDSEWTGQASLGLASALAAQGKTNDAIAEFEKIRKRFASHEVIDDARLSLARLYEASKPEEAFKLYEELVKPGGQAISMNQMGGPAAEAAMRQEDLLKRHPELEKLRPPPTPPITMTSPMGNTNMQVRMGTNRTIISSTTTTTGTTSTPPAATPIQIRTVPNSAAPTPGSPNTAPAISPAPAKAPAPAPAPKSP